MKVTAINGSPNKNGNTAKALEIMTGELDRLGVETEIIHVGGELIHGCIACGKCFKADPKCVFNDDPVNEVTAKLRAADGYILGSPTYFGGIAGAMKCFLDRAFYSSYGSGLLRHKAATVVAVARRSGGVEVVNQLKHYLTLSEALIAPSQYWTLIHGAVPGEIEKDHEGVAVIKRNAEALAWLLKMTKATKVDIQAPEFVKRPRTNFISS
ncbi:MAG: flavodoxin family protein [Defluviitaleaceae bacterium]|nr:flavodoxin family protein [Defluviitaleaceae bacterium]